MKKEWRDHQWNQKNPSPFFQESVPEVIFILLAKLVDAILFETDQKACGQQKACQNPMEIKMVRMQVQIAQPNKMDCNGEEEVISFIVWKSRFKWNYGK